MVRMLWRIFASQIQLPYQEGKIVEAFIRYWVAIVIYWHRVWLVVWAIAVGLFFHYAGSWLAETWFPLLAHILAALAVALVVFEGFRLVLTITNLGDDLGEYHVHRYRSRHPQFNYLAEKGGSLDLPSESVQAREEVEERMMAHRCAQERVDEMETCRRRAA